MEHGLPEPTPSTQSGALSGDEFFTRVYDELRALAAAKLARERPGHSLQPTALVNEAYLRLQQVPGVHPWQNRRHFFTAAAEAMRRVLVENARRKKVRNQDLAERAAESPAASELPLDDLLDVNEVLDKFAEHDPAAAELVKLHYFGGLSIDEAADLLGTNRRTAFRHWRYARAWLYRQLGKERGDNKPAE